MLSECGSIAILDTACTTSVASERWLKNFAKDVKLRREKSSARIVFGNNLGSESLYKVFLPVRIEDFCCVLEIEIISGFLPLLLSVKSMHKMGIMIDLNTYTLDFPGVQNHIQLQKLTSGHIGVHLELNTVTLALATFPELDLKSIEKLHRQFGHCTAKKLCELLRNCGHKNDNINELAKEALSSCDVCVKFGRSEPKPVVSLPLSSGFNDVVALDLHQVTEISNNCYYIHIIDLFTRYSAAKLIFDKTAETIFQTLNSIWIFVYGAPNTILSDNGREFDNELFRENAGFFNMCQINSCVQSLVKWVLRET